MNVKQITVGVWNIVLTTMSVGIVNAHSVTNLLPMIDHALTSMNVQQRMVVAQKFVLTCQEATNAAVKSDELLEQMQKHAVRIYLGKFATKSH